MLYLLIYCTSDFQLTTPQCCKISQSTPAGKDPSAITTPVLEATHSYPSCNYTHHGNNFPSCPHPVRILYTQQAPGTLARHNLPSHNIYEQGMGTSTKTQTRPKTGSRYPAYKTESPKQRGPACFQGKKSGQGQ